MDRIRVIVTGSRHWYCLEIAGQVVRRLKARHGDALVIVHGAAPGVDRAFDDAAAAEGVAREPHPARWRELGNGAGPVRNGEMVAAGAALCVAVHRDLKASRGTKDCVRKALAAGIPVWLVDSEDVWPRKVEAALPTNPHR
jgi:hypothetical protein